MEGLLERVLGKGGEGLRLVATRRGNIQLTSIPARRVQTRILPPALEYYSKVLTAHLSYASAAISDSFVMGVACTVRRVRRVHGGPSVSVCVVITIRGSSYFGRLPQLSLGLLSTTTIPNGMPLNGRHSD